MGGFPSILSVGDQPIGNVQRAAVGYDENGGTTEYNVEAAGADGYVVCKSLPAPGYSQKYPRKLAEPLGARLDISQVLAVAKARVFRVMCLC